MIAAVLAAVRCGGVERQIILECPSADGSLKAVYWVRMAGPAAGSVDYYLSVVAAQTPAAKVLADEAAPVVWLKRSSNVHLVWRGSDTLLVRHAPEAIVQHASESVPLSPQARPRVLQATENDMDHSWCSVESGTRDGRGVPSS